MRLIVGLGNPGREYAWTRHNLGWQVVAYLAEEWRIPLSKKSLESVWGQGRVGGETVILAQPTTFMNLSGQAVSRLSAYFKLSPENLVVVHDDLDVPLWRIKIVERGGPGGHRGILSLIGQLHTEEFLRVKLGIGRPPADDAHGELCSVPFSGGGGGKCRPPHRTGGPGGGLPDSGRIASGPESVPRGGDGIRGGNG